MTDIAIGYALFVILLFSLGQIVLAVYIRFSRRKTRYELLVAKTQGRFADARLELLQLATQDKISVHSITFKYLHYLNTLFMRRPDRYEDLSRALQYMSMKHVYDNDSTAHVLQKESESWSEETKQAVLKTCQALDYIVVDYSLPFKIVYYLLRLRHPEITPLQALGKIAKQRYVNAQKAKQVYPIVEESQQELYKLVGSH